jgi:predicted O-methyltransferase YrrM
MIRRLRRLFHRSAVAAWPPPPVVARHAEPSYLFSADDDHGRPTPELLETALKMIDRARRTDLTEITDRLPPADRQLTIWPGEHYSLLAAAVGTVQPRMVIEIGTATGLSALCLLQGLPVGCRVVTFDLLPWKKYPGTLLKDVDFADGRLNQQLADLSDPAVFAAHADLLRQTDVLFVDAPKDGKFEPAFLGLLDTFRFDRPPLVILDDIRLWNMLPVWRNIRRPKLDLTGFGHWSGTGLVLWE